MFSKNELNQTYAQVAPQFIAFLENEQAKLTTQIERLKKNTQPTSELPQPTSPAMQPTQSETLLQEPAVNDIPLDELVPPPVEEDFSDIPLDELDARPETEIDSSKELHS